MRVLLHQSTLYPLGIHSSVASALTHTDAVIFDGRISMIDHMTLKCKLLSATSILPDAGNNDNCVVLHGVYMLHNYSLHSTCLQCLYLVQ